MAGGRWKVAGQTESSRRSRAKQTQKKAKAPTNMPMPIYLVAYTLPVTYHPCMPASWRPCPCGRDNSNVTKPARPGISSRQQTGKTGRSNYLSIHLQHLIYASGFFSLNLPLLLSPSNIFFFPIRGDPSMPSRPVAPHRLAPGAPFESRPRPLLGGLPLPT